MRLELHSIRFLLHQFCEKRKTAYLVRFRIHIYVLDRALPESLFMLFIERSIHFLPVAAKGGKKTVIGAERGGFFLAAIFL